MKKEKVTKNQYGMHQGASHKIFQNAKQLRYNLTDAEIRLWEAVKSKKLGTKFRRQHPIATYIVDFYCHSAKLIIELDGGYHNEADQKELDSKRTENLNKLDLKVIRFTNKQIMIDLEFVLEEIKKHLS